MNLKRCKSTPGLVESAGKVPIQASCITRHHTLPAGLPTRSSSTDQLQTAPRSDEQLDKDSFQLGSAGPSAPAPEPGQPPGVIR